MATVWIDGKAYEVDGSKNMLDVALSLGLDLPYFCWHPAMGSVGACRQCAVQQYKDAEGEEKGEGKMVMACMTPAKDGTRIRIHEEEAERFRAAVIEWLMANHPHDCPVCDEGGECHLQDMTVMTGHAWRRYRFSKRTHRNQYLGPFLNHEMNRCIQCYRCVRFYNDHAQDRDLAALASHDHVYFGRHTEGTLESVFSGNLVEVCPTGVFTDKSLKAHYTRKWDLQTAPSVCGHCGVGCNTTPGERYGTLRRIRNRYHSEVNGYFLCDRGRYGYEYQDHERRLSVPLAPGGTDSPAQPLEPDEALDRVRSLLRNGMRAVGIGSPRASVESNFALRELVGPDRFHRGVPEAQARAVDAVLDELGRTRGASLSDVEKCDAVLVLGEDAQNTAPMLELALRQSVRNQPMAHAETQGVGTWHAAAFLEAIQDDNGPLYVATPAPTATDRFATRTLHAAPEDIARLGLAVAGQLPKDDLANEIVEALSNAKRPLVVSGASLHSEAVVRAAGAAARALDAEVFFTVPECNSLGLAMLGGGTLEDALGAEADVAVVLEADLPRRPEATHLVVLDSLASDVAAHADVVLPTATLFESDGHLVNHEARAQRFHQVFVPETQVRPAWSWLTSIAGSDAANLAQRREDAKGRGAQATPRSQTTGEGGSQHPSGSINASDAANLAQRREDAKGRGAQATPGSQTTGEGGSQHPSGSINASDAANLAQRREDAKGRGAPATPRSQTTGEGGSQHPSGSINASDAANLAQRREDAKGRGARGEPGAAPGDLAQGDLAQRREDAKGRGAPATPGSQTTGGGESDRLSNSDPEASSAALRLGGLARPSSGGGHRLSDVTKAAAKAIPLLARLPEASPAPGDRAPDGEGYPRMLHRYSGRTAQHAHRTIREPRPVADPNDPLVYTMEGWEGPRPPGRLVNEFWAPGWNSIQALNRFQEEVAGPLIGGEPGIRLLESAEGEAPKPEPPEAFRRRDDAFRVVPLWHTFGSDPLSVLSPGVAERSEEPYVALSREDAERLGDTVTLRLDDREHALPVRAVEGLPAGVAGVPVLPGLAGARVPERASLAPASTTTTSTSTNEP
ncbi:MAG: NADH-quinone oxidoreductase subunit NuoG [Myxococcota bacterium]